MTQFVAEAYASGYATSEIADLEGDMVDGIAHRHFGFPEGPVVDDTLISFATSTGSANWYGEAVASWSHESEASLPPPASPPGGQAAAFRTLAPDSGGQDSAVVFAVRSHAVMLLVARDEVPIDPSRLDGWAAAQIAKLPS